MITSCSFRAFGGCSCAPGQCQSATVPIAKTLNATRRSYRLLEASIVAFYVAVAIVCGITLDNHFKREALVNQEQISWNR